MLPAMRPLTLPQGSADVDEETRLFAQNRIQVLRRTLMTLLSSSQAPIHTKSDTIKEVYTEMISYGLIAGMPMSAEVKLGEMLTKLFRWGKPKEKEEDASGIVDALFEERV